MAGYRRRGGRRGFNPYNQKAYQFTARRRAALKKAQAKSARKRKITMGIMAVGGVAAVGTAAYFGVKNKETVSRNVQGAIRTVNPYYRNRAAAIKKARTAVNPANKEAVRIGGAISPAGTPNVNAPTAGAVQAHVPGSTRKQDAKPSTHGYTRTVLDPVDPDTIRQYHQQEDDFRATTEGSLEKFLEPDDAEVKKVMSGEQVTRAEAKKALYRRNAAVARRGKGEAYSKEEINQILDRFVIEGTISSNTKGYAAAVRRNPKAAARHTAANSGVTQAEADALSAVDTPLKPVLGTPGTRGVVKIPGSQPATSAVVPGLGNTKSPFGMRVSNPAPGVTTPPANPANVSARQSTRKDAKPAEQLPLFSDVKPHAPSAAPVGFAIFVGEQYSGWDELTASQRRAAKKKATEAGYYIHYKTGIIDKIP